ncbi:MAG: magnesium transporter MgtE N-terminal domain-containing protein [Dermatophilaceae bacterium]
MTPGPTPTAPQPDMAVVERAVATQDLSAITAALQPLRASEAVSLRDRDRAVVYRLLPKDKALEVFEALDASLQGHLVQALQDEDVAGVFAEMDPDDRVTLLDELPASVATRLLQNLPPGERDLTAAVLGYPQGSIGRRMSPEYVSTHPELTAAQTLVRVRGRIGDAETIYTLAVTDSQRRLVGIVSLRDLMHADPDTAVADLMHPPHSVQATTAA